MKVVAAIAIAATGALASDSNKALGTALGELLTQRFEQLESPEFAPRQVGAAAAFAADAAAEPASPSASPRALPFVIPAPEAAAELAIDNVVLGQWLAVLPALLRFTGSSGSLVDFLRRLPLVGVATPP